jgi:hypothetical protein
VKPGHLTCVVPFLLTGQAEAVTLSDQGRARATVVLPDRPREEEKRAGTELATYLGKLTGGTFQTVAESLPPAAAPRVFLGATAAAQRAGFAAGAGISAAKLDRDGFVLRVSGGDLFIVGHDAGATELGVHLFLQKFGGIRWCIPRELGEHIPPTPTFSVPDSLNETHEPTWKSRLWSSPSPRDKMWPQRNLCRSRYEFHHHLLTVLQPSKVHPQHPDWYPMIGGKRIAQPADGSHAGQPCFSNRAMAHWVAEQAIAAFDLNPETTSFSLGLNDCGAGGYCQCPGCQALADKAKPTSRGRPGPSGEREG